MPDIYYGLLKYKCRVVDHSCHALYLDSIVYTYIMISVFDSFSPVTVAWIGVYFLDYFLGIYCFSVFDLLDQISAFILELLLSFCVRN